MARRASDPVVIEWDETEVKAFLDNPNGPLGVVLMTRLAEVVVKGAKRRALVDTGTMAREITYKLGSDSSGLYADVISPARSKKGFPYPIVHEGKKVRDRRPHRSLKPALNDIRNILSG